MTRDKIEAEIRITLAKLLETDLSGVGSDDDLGAAIGLDSLGRLELLSELEERFDLIIDDIDSDRPPTISAMTETVETALATLKGAA